MIRFVPNEKRKEHAEQLRKGLAALGPNFLATICWWCDGETFRNFEHCTVCGAGKSWGMGLGLLIHDQPAPISVVNQVLCASSTTDQVRG